MKFLLATILSAAAVSAASFSAYCTDYDDMVLTGAVANSKCTDDKRCSLKKAAQECDSIAACEGITCNDGNSKCALRSGTVLTAGDKKDRSFLKADNTDCKKATINKQGGNDDLDYATYKIASGSGMDSGMATLLAGGDMKDMMLIGMDGNSDMSTMEAMMMGADMGDVLMFDMIMGSNNKMTCPEGTRPVDTPSGRRCVSNRPAPVVTNPPVVTTRPSTVITACPAGTVAMYGRFGRSCVASSTTTTTTPRGCLDGSVRVTTATGYRDICNSAPAPVAAPKTSRPNGCGKICKRNRRRRRRQQARARNAAAAAADGNP